MPYEDLTGGSGFVSNSEGAEANLNINMSEESVRNLWDVQAAVQQIAVDFQTVVRSAADFQSYLISIRETSQTIRMPSLGMEGGEGGNMAYSGGRVDTASVPSIQSSEASMVSRIGEMEENASGAGGGALSAHGSNAMRGFDANEAISQMTNIGWLASMAGNSHTGSPQETISAYEQEYQFGLRNKKNLAVKSAGGARAFAASRIIQQNLPAAQQFLSGGGAGGFAAGIGRLGAYGAVAYAGYQVANAALETYAQSRALGIATNYHGAGWGLQQRVGQATMAMSPFVSQEEASQIYGMAIDQGWASRRGGFEQGDFSQAIGFMYGAAKDYNMDPAMSAQLLQSSSLNAGESVQALNQQLLTLKQTLDGTGVSMSVANSTFTDFTSFLTGAGANPGDAARVVSGTLKSFAGSTFFGPNASGAQMTMAALQSPQVQAILGGLEGNMPGAALAGGNLDRSMAELQNWIHQTAVQYSSMTNLSMENRAAAFAVAYKGFTGQDLNQAAAERLMTEAAANPNYLTQGQADVQAASGLQLQKRSKTSALFNSMDDVHFWLGADLQPAQTLSEREKNRSIIDAYQYYSPEINALLATSDLSSTVLYGPDGKPVMQGGNRVAGANIAKWFSDKENFNKFNAPGSGYYIQDKSMNKWNASNIGAGGESGDVTGGKGDANTIYITLSPQAKQWFDTNKTRLDLANGKYYGGGG